MRLKLTLYAEKRPCQLPVNYHGLLQGLIYARLAKADSVFATHLHNVGFRQGPRTFKLFVFSDLFPQGRYKDGTLLFKDGDLSWFVASPVDAFLRTFADGLLSEHTFNVGSTSVFLKSVETLPAYSNGAQAVRLSPLSPVCVPRKRVDNSRAANGFSVVIPECLNRESSYSECRNLGNNAGVDYLSPADSEFIPLIVQNVLRKYEAFKGTVYSGNGIQLSVPEDWLTKFNQEPRKFSRLLTFKQGHIGQETRIKGYMVPFLAEGDPVLIQLALDCGLGAKNSSGFGFVTDSAL